MRAIKFKAKREDNGQWVTGDLLQHIDGTILIGDNTGPWADDGYSHCDYHQVYKVDPTTVCQFTGSLDKNGKEIYEGDVILIGPDSYTVVWEDLLYGFCLKADNAKLPVTIPLGETLRRRAFEVVGNIHGQEREIKSPRNQYELAEEIDEAFECWKESKERKLKETFGTTNPLQIRLKMMEKERERIQKEREESERRRKETNS